MRRNGLAVFAGNMPRCYVTRFEDDTLVSCASIAQSLPTHPTAGCTHVDERQAPCDPAVRPCPPGYGLFPMKCQGSCEGPPRNAQAAMVPLQNVSEIVRSIRGRAARDLIDDPVNLHGKRIYLFRGIGDDCYVPGACRTLPRTTRARPVRSRSRDATRDPFSTRGGHCVPCKRCCRSHRAILRRLRGHHPLQRLGGPRRP